MNKQKIYSFLFHHLFHIGIPLAIISAFLLIYGLMIFHWVLYITGFAMLVVSVALGLFLGNHLNDF